MHHHKLKILVLPYSSSSKHNPGSDRNTWN